MVTRIILSICLIAFSMQGFTQERELVSRKVYFYIKYNGNLTAKTLSPSNSELKAPVGNLLGDSRTVGFIPYDTRWSMDVNMSDLQAPLYSYLYNDIFLVNGITEYGSSITKMGVSNGNFFKSIKLSYDSLRNSNNSYVTKESIGSVAKIWVIDAVWEAYSLDEKPNYLKGITPSNLFFKSYNIFLLKKIKSITPWVTPEPNSLVKIVHNGTLVSLGQK